MNIAGQWADRSGMALEMKRDPSYQTRHDIKETLMEEAFLGILEALPDLKINPRANLRSYLTTIGWRRLYELHSRISHRHQHEQDRLPGSTDDEATNDFTDPRSDEHYEQLIEAMSAPSCIKAIYSYWRRNLTAENWRIMIIRLRGTPPSDDEIAELQRSGPPPDSEEWRTMIGWLVNRTKCTSQEIAKMMGPGWTKEQVRTRVHRILHDTKVYLQGHGYAEFTDIKEIGFADIKEIGHAELTEITKVRMDESTIALLRTRAARRFWEQKSNRIDRWIIAWCIEEGNTPTYQQVAERLGPGWEADEVRKRANQVVDETRAYLRASGEIEV